MDAYYGWVFFSATYWLFWLGDNVKYISGFRGLLHELPWALDLRFTHGARETRITLGGSKSFSCHLALVFLGKER